MLQLQNHTPFESALTVLPDEHGIDCLYVTVKATFEISPKLRIADEQVPIRMVDEYWGKPGESSLKYAGEVHLLKPATDVVVVGHAQAPEQRRVTRLDVSASVGAVHKRVRVFGDREWTGRRLGRSISPPEPFETMPLVYERAFGGTRVLDEEKQKVVYEERNPVGRGIRGRRWRGVPAGERLPNLEDVGRPLKKPRKSGAPACFGFVAPHWEPRKSFAGTYDETWTRVRSPYLPLDFDPRFFNVAHPDLMSPRPFEGGEPVQLINLSPTGPLRFRLPTCLLSCKVRVAKRVEPVEFRLETVLLEPDESRLCLSWRGAMSCSKQALRIKDVTIDVVALDLPEGAV